MTFPRLHAHRRPEGMPAFSLLWLGQLVSLLGSGMTRFALTIWAYQQTGSATVLALVAFVSFGPGVLLSPVAGAIVDRWDRRRVLILTDLAAGLATAVLLALHLTGRLEVWHLLALGAFAGAFEAFQFPAFSAAVTVLVPRKHYARASGMQSMAGAASAIAAPVLAGLALTAFGLSAVMLADLVTFLFAVGSLLLIRIPAPPRSDEGEAARANLWQESLFGFRYIAARRGLLGLLLVFLPVNLFATMGMVLLAPMVLARSGGSELALGTVQSAAGAGALVGGLVLAAWGGPRRRIHGVLAGMTAGSLAGPVLMGLGGTQTAWLLGAFGMTFFLPIINGSSQAIWQAKVEPDVQGRVFAARRLIAQVSAPLAMLVAGPLADRLFEPLLLSGAGPIATRLGALFGQEPGSGMAAILALTGLITAAIGLAGYLFPDVREVETRLPDHELAREDRPDAAGSPTARDANRPEAETEAETDPGPSPQPAPASSAYDAAEPRVAPRPEPPLAPGPVARPAAPSTAAPATGRSNGPRRALSRATSARFWYRAPARPGGMAPDTAGAPSAAPAPAVGADGGPGPAPRPLASTLGRHASRGPDAAPLLEAAALALVALLALAALARLALGGLRGRS